MFLWFNEETFCLVKQVFLQSCLLVSYRKIIVGSWVLLLFLFFEYLHLPTPSAAHPDTYCFTFLQRREIHNDLSSFRGAYRSLVMFFRPWCKLASHLSTPNQGLGTFQSLRGIGTGMEPRRDPHEPGTPVLIDVFTCGLLLCLTAVCWTWVPL